MSTPHKPICYPSDPNCQFMWKKCGVKPELRKKIKIKKAREELYDKKQWNSCMKQNYPSFPLGSFAEEYRRRHGKPGYSNKYPAPKFGEWVQEGGKRRKRKKTKKRKTKKKQSKRKRSQKRTKRRRKSRKHSRRRRRRRR